MRKSLSRARNKRMFTRGTLSGKRNPVTNTLVRGGYHR